MVAKRSEAVVPLRRLLKSTAVVGKDRMKKSQPKAIESPPVARKGQKQKIAAPKKEAKQSVGKMTGAYTDQTQRYIMIFA